MMHSFAETPVTWVIFIITIAVSLLAFGNEQLYQKFMLHPYSVARGKESYTIITSGFVHRDWIHLLFNMIAFYSFSFNLEVLLGHWQFALLYMVSLILSDLPTIAKQKDNWGYHSLGASGAISAAIFSFILFDPRGEIAIYGIPMPCWVFGGLYLAYCWYASKQSRDTINHDAHFYGALSGILITIILVPKIVPYFLHQFGV